jgi:nucleotide-binding universal stress UspA family protein
MVPRDLGNGDRTPEYTYPVIVGVDGSFAAIRAARWAAAVAEKFAAPLHIVHVAAGRTPSDGIANLGGDMAVQRESAKAVLQSAEHAVRADFKGLHITSAQVDGSADQALIESSRVARLIVLGSDELSLGTAILVGSTTITAVGWRSRRHSSSPIASAWESSLFMVGRHGDRRVRSRFRS